MTKKIILALFIAIAVKETGFAQEIQKTDTSTQKKIKRNEIGINISPAAALVLGAYPDNAKFSVSFKHIVRENNALRFSFNYFTNWNDSYWYYANNYDIISQTDSTQVRRQQQYHNGNKMQVNAGYEWRKGKKKIKYFFGSDLILGSSSDSYYMFDNTYTLKKGNHYHTNNSANDTLYYFQQDYNSSPTSIKSIHSNYYFVGTSPFIGLICPLSKRFLLTAQVGLDVALTYVKVKTDDHIQKTSSNLSTYFLDIDTPGVVNDFSLVYRF